MKRLEFNDYEEFACEVADTFDDIHKNDDFDDIAIIAHHDEAKQIIREILCLGYDLNSIELKNPELGYDDVPYIISVCGIDSEHEVWCEPMLRENGYITDDSPVMYILDNCSSKVIPYCKGKTVYEVSVGDDDCSCDECGYDDSEEEGFTINGKPATKEEFDSYVSQFKKNDEKPATTSTSSTTYKVNGKEVDKETYEKALNELDEKYLDNVQDMLLSYFDFVSEMNQWRKLLGW